MKGSVPDKDKENEPLNLDGLRRFAGSTSQVVQIFRARFEQRERVSGPLVRESEKVIHMLMDQFKALNQVMDVFYGGPNALEFENILLYTLHNLRGNDGIQNFIHLLESIMTIIDRFQRVLEAKNQEIQNLRRWLDECEELKAKHQAHMDRLKTELETAQEKLSGVGGPKFSEVVTSWEDLVKAEPDEEVTPVKEKETKKTE